MSTETLDGDAVREFAPGGGLDGISITRRRFRLDRRLGLAALGLLVVVGIPWYGWNWWEAVALSKPPTTPMSAVT